MRARFQGRDFRGAISEARFHDRFFRGEISGARFPDSQFGQLKVICVYKKLNDVTNKYALKNVVPHMHLSFLKQINSKIFSEEGK